MGKGYSYFLKTMSADARASCAAPISAFQKAHAGSLRRNASSPSEKASVSGLGWSAERFEDCGVAGLWRIQSAIAEINKADVVIVVAGLDAALASVVGGLTDKPLFAVPTSVGYGIAEHGKTALSSMLASCAPGIGVFNIDNGYGAACAAARVLRAMYPDV